MFVISLILLMVVIFGGLAFFLRHLLTRNISSATSHLQRMLKDTAGKEEQIKKKIEEAELKYKEILDRAEKEAAELKEKAAKEIDTQRDQVIEQAHKQSEELIERAHKTCEAIKQELQKNINEQAIELAQDLACEIIPEDIAQAMHNKWLESLIASDIEGLDKLKISQELHTVEVLTAFALNDDQRNRLKDSLQKKLEREIEMKEELKTDLVAGIVVRFGNLVFDGSFSDKVKELANESLQGQD